MTTYQTPRDAKKLARSVRIGDKLYTINNHRITHPGAEAQTYSEHVVCKKSGITGNLMVSDTVSVDRLVTAFGPVYDRPPRGMRNLAEQRRNVCEPIVGGSEDTRYLSGSEIDGMEKDVRRAREERGVKHRWF